jgi:hypothetical protein
MYDELGNMPEKIEQTANLCVIDADPGGSFRFGTVIEIELGERGE